VDNAVFAFGPFRLKPSERQLLEEGKPLPLRSRALDILATLVEHACETIRTEELIARTWPDTVVDEGALRGHVAPLRRALGDGRAGKRYIANDPGRGYTFVAPVTREQRQETAAPPNGPAIGSNFPPRLTRVIGRAEIIPRVVARVDQRRFLTIVGPGGIGKTTVALAAAQALSGSYAHGVWFAGLASLQDPALVPRRGQCGPGQPTRRRRSAQ
jgi:DNA-binding winged helix-turn-helix (wHTH) protein